MAININDIVGDPVKRANLENRFWQKVRKKGPKACWPWIAKARHAFGYGAINSGRGNLYYSHVVAYALDQGHIPAGAYVLHSCDNPGCCNPAHLRLGTKAENTADMVSRRRLIGRTGPVDSKRCAKRLTARDAEFIRSSSLPRKELAAMLGVTTHSIANVQSGRTWAK